MCQKSEAEMCPNEHPMLVETFKYLKHYIQIMSEGCEITF